MGKSATRAKSSKATAGKQQPSLFGFDPVEVEPVEVEVESPRATKGVEGLVTVQPHGPAQPENLPPANVPTPQAAALSRPEAAGSAVSAVPAARAEASAPTTAAKQPAGEPDLSQSRSPSPAPPSPTPPPPPTPHVNRTATQKRKPVGKFGISPISSIVGQFRSTARWKKDEWERPLDDAVRAANQEEVRLGFPAGVSCLTSEQWAELARIEQQIEEAHRAGMMDQFRQLAREWLSVCVAGMRAVRDGLRKVAASQDKATQTTQTASAAQGGVTAPANVPCLSGSALPVGITETTKQPPPAKPGQNSTVESSLTEKNCEITSIGIDGADDFWDV